MAKLASRTVEPRVGIKRRYDRPRWLPVVNIVEEVKSLHTEIETIFAARARGPKHSTGSATPASAAKSTRTQPSSWGPTSTASPAAVPRAAARRSALSRAVVG